MGKNSDYILRNYYCKICNKDHKIKLSKNLLKNKLKMPFPHIFLHGELKNILTTLYLDKELQIRGVDVHELTDEDLFSKEQAIIITKTLVEEIEKLAEENLNLIEENRKLKKMLNQ